MTWWVLIFPLAGLLMIIIPAIKYYKVKSDISNGTYMVSDGQVIDYKEIRDDEGGTTYAPIYEFYANGKPYRCVSGASYGWMTRKPRKIAYNPNNPTDCKTVGGNLPLVIFGVVFFVFSIIITILAI